MTQDHWLTVQQVSSIGTAISTGMSMHLVSQAIARFRHATLPGVLDYYFLRRVHPQLPRLPNEITGIDFVRSLKQALGRQVGVPSTNELSAQSWEFYIYNAKEYGQLETEIAFFQSRFGKSCSSVGLPPPIVRYLEAGLAEMMDNSALHSAATTPVISGYMVEAGVAQFVVFDFGVGVLQRLRSSSTYANVDSDLRAIELAITDGVTTDLTGRGGFGFRDLFRVIANEGGNLRFRSGEGCVAIDGAGTAIKRTNMTGMSQIPGFQVCVTTMVSALSGEKPLV